MTQCLHAFFRTGEGDKPHVCISTELNAGTCKRSYSFPPPGPYSSVCGRIAAYQLGTDPIGFSTTPMINVNSAYLRGVSLTHGGDLDGTADLANHIWSFAVGSTQDQTSTPANDRCPCDQGSPSPSFVGEDYFCESGNTAVPASSMATFFPGNFLWDGLGCIPSSTCCIDHPLYFVKHLGAATTDNIDLRTCLHTGSNFDNIALELIEIYVK